MKTALTDQLARKSLRLSPKSEIEYTIGQRISALGSDCSYIEWSFPDIVNVIVQPLTIIIGFVLLIVNLGSSALVVSTG